MATAVKKKVENSAQKAWWRMALTSVQPSSMKSVSAFFMTCGAPAAKRRHGNSATGNSTTSTITPNS